MPTNKEAARVLAHPNGQRCELTQIHNHILLHAVRFGKVFCKTCAVMLALLTGSAGFPAYRPGVSRADADRRHRRPELGLRRMVYAMRDGGGAAMTPYVMRAAFRTNAPDKHLEFYRTVQDILHNKSMTEIEQLNRIRMMAGAAAYGEAECADIMALTGEVAPHA